MKLSTDTNVKKVLAFVSSIVRKLKNKDREGDNMRILVTGFEPFLDFKTNPTMEIVEVLNGQVIEGYDVFGRILPVDFEVARNELIDVVEDIEPDIIISLGLAAGRFKITPERVALNVRDGEKDNNSYKPNGEKISEAGKDSYFSQLPLTSIIDTLQEAGYPAEISNSAGTYVCNSVMYEGLRYAKGHPNMIAGFIHIPADFKLAIAHGRIPGWHQRDLMEAVKIAIATTIKGVK